MKPVQGNKNEKRKSEEIAKQWIENDGMKSERNVHQFMEKDRK